jgi:hypothetical protein
MGLRPTHLGYAYQDLVTALRLVDLMLGHATTVIVDTKAFKGDLFDDITSEWSSGSRQRLQIKHTANEWELTSDSFTAKRRGLRLDAIVTSVDEDLRDHPGTSYRIVLRDTEPQEPDLTAVLMGVDPSADPARLCTACLAPGCGSTRRPCWQRTRGARPWPTSTRTCSAACATRWSSTSACPPARLTSAPRGQRSGRCSAEPPRSSARGAHRTGTGRRRT